MAVTKELLSKISQYEQDGYSPDEIVKGLSESTNYPDIAAKTKHFISTGYKPGEILKGLKTSPILEDNPVIRPLKQYGGRVIERIKNDIEGIRKDTNIFKPLSLVGGLAKTIDIPLAPIGEAFGNIPRAASEIGVISPETAEKLAPIAEITGTIGLGLVKTAPSLLAKSLSVLGIGNPEVPMAERMAQFFAPNKAKEVVKASLRKGLAEVQQAKDQIWNIAKDRFVWWESVPEVKKIKFLDMVEKGKVQTGLMIKEFGPEHGLKLAETAAEYRSRLNKAFQMSAKYEDNLHYIENYFPHLWKDPEKSRQFFSGYTAKLDKQQFMKKRYYDLIEDGRAAGLELKTSNPEMLVMFRENSGLQHQMAKEFFKDMKNQDMLKAVTQGNIPNGWAEIHSPYIPPLAITDSEGKNSVLQRTWAMPEEAAKVVNRWLSPSLWSRNDLVGKIWKGAMASKNIRTGIVLGINAFHGVNTSLSDIASMQTLALKQFARGNILDGLKSFVISPFSPAISGYKGGDIIKAWNTGVGTAEELEAVNLLKRAGGRVQMGQQFSFGLDNQLKLSIANIKNDKIFEGVGRLIPGLAESISKPILGWYVPRLKVNTFTNLAKDFIEAHPQLTEKEMDIGLGRLWDSIDNRFGQLVYDNLFWNRTLRDVSVGSMLSLGWNFGTWREFGGAIKDIGVTGLTKGKVKPVTMDRILFSITYPMTVGIVGGMMTWALSGKAPEKPLDYYYPKTGRKDKNNNDERIGMPSMMKEFFGLSESVRKKGPLGIGEYASHKQSPDIALMTDLLLNRNFYNEEIRTPGSPYMQQAREMLAHIYKSTAPISFQSQQRTQGLGALPWLGFNLAPRFITSSKTQLEISDLYERRVPPGVKSIARSERFREFGQVREFIKQGREDEASNLFFKLKGQGKTRETYSQFRKRSQIQPDIYMFRRLPEEDKMALFKDMTPSEKEKYRPHLKKTLRN